MKTRRKKKLRYDGNLLRQFRRQRKFEAFMHLFAEKCRARMGSQIESSWLARWPDNAPSNMGGVLTKLKLDETANYFGVSHP